MKPPRRRYVSGWDDSRTEPPPPNWRAALWLCLAVAFVVCALTCLRPLIGAYMRWWMQ